LFWILKFRVADEISVPLNEIEPNIPADPVKGKGDDGAYEADTAYDDERAYDALVANDEDAMDPEKEPVIEEAKIPPLTIKPFSIIYSLAILE